MIVVGAIVGFVGFVWFLTLSLCRAAALADEALADFADVYCPLCDGTDLDDWGEPGWWSCRPCQHLFEMKEPSR